ncbi:S8 family peptidase [Anaerosporobacter faecicola]|uniref:S8 family peptidase n=1 Tax=Anaerosporobacter faecicola TaxID=2718714 RepID=UPI00143A96AD|nr:S8 family peptidase [Anaerosporobacter faecicola]
MNRARDIVHAKAAYERGIYGNGIGVAVVDTGIMSHMDFIADGNRIVAFKDVIHGRVDLYDDNGHGTHVSGIIGGNGVASDGKYMGIAPKCNIISVKALNYKGNGNVSDVLSAFEWIIENQKKYNIRIVNISVGSTSEEASEDSNLVVGVDDLWDRGFVVVVAAGNNGPGPRTISMPGISRKVITVGASDDNVSVEVFGTRTIDYSGRGPTPACIKKPDVVAPGSNIVSCCPPGSESHGNRGLLFGRARNEPYGKMYTNKSGTSMATPIVTGAMALLLSAYPDMTNREVKIRIKNSSTDMGLLHQQQGWGLLNIKKLIP